MTTINRPHAWWTNGDERREAIDEAMCMVKDNVHGVVTVTKSGDGFDIVGDYDDFVGRFVNESVDIEQWEGDEPSWYEATFSDRTPEDYVVFSNITGWLNLAPVKDFLAGRRDEVSLWAEPATVWWTDGEQYKVSDEVTGDTWVMCAD